MGSNTQVEIIALLGVLYCAKWLSIETMDVFKDSKVVIEWVMEISTFDPPMFLN